MGGKGPEGLYLLVFGPFLIDQAKEIPRCFKANALCHQRGETVAKFSVLQFSRIREADSSVILVFRQDRVAGRHLVEVFLLKFVLSIGKAIRWIRPSNDDGKWHGEHGFAEEGVLIVLGRLIEQEVKADRANTGRVHVH